MTVIIENTNKTRQGTRIEIKRDEYTVNNREDCRDKHDRYVYDLVVEHGCKIVVVQAPGAGKTTGQPAPTTDINKGTP